MILSRSFCLTVLLVSVSSSKAQSLDWLWARNGGLPESAVGYSSAIDGSGNIWVVGEFKGVLELGNTTLNTSSFRKGFIAKLDAAGTWLWASSFGSTGDFTSTHVGGIVIASDGSAYVGGSFQGTAAFGTLMLTEGASEEAFIGHIDAGGDWLWVSRPPNAYDYQLSRVNSICLKGEEGSTLEENLVLVWPI
jgi:hypothetical protein